MFRKNSFHCFSYLLTFSLVKGLNVTLIDFFNFSYADFKLLLKNRALSVDVTS